MKTRKAKKGPRRTKPEVAVGGRIPQLRRGEFYEWRRYFRERRIAAKHRQREAA